MDHVDVLDREESFVGCPFTVAPVFVAAGLTSLLPMIPSSHDPTL